MERDGGADGADELEREAARAAAVEQLELLGAPVDGELDAVVRVAAALAGAQHATVTLLGARRQCLLADGAFRDTDPASGELPCARVVRGGRTVHVPDASAVPELAATAWVDGREGALRMYASVPLVTAEGHAVGTLCVGDPAPRALGDDVLARLEDLAGVVVALLERRLTARRAAALAAEAHEQRCRAERTLAALEERTELAEAVLDSLDVGVVAAGPDGRLTLFNRAAQRWHGLPADPALAPGEHPGRYALFEADGTTPLAPERVPLHRALAEGRVLAQEIVIAPSGSPPRTVLVSGRAMARPDGRPLGAVVAQHDVTTERRHRRALEQAHRALAERTAELERSNAELERFAAAASHDLRSPLTVVEGYLELIEDTCGEELPERAAEWLATAVPTPRRMKHLTGGLLDYASAGAPAPRLQVVETSELLEAALADLRAEIDAAGAAVTTGALPRAACDPVAVRQVLQNLLANAVKHRAPGRPCRVAVSAERTPEGAWAFSVADNGRGVPPEDRERVFAMFATLREGSARTPSDRERGHGIGLATCQRLVARGGGRIWLEGTPGGGTTARFTLAPARA